MRMPKFLCVCRHFYKLDALPFVISTTQRQHVARIWLHRCDRRGHGIEDRSPEPDDCALASVHCLFTETTNQKNEKRTAMTVPHPFR